MDNVIFRCNDAYREAVFAFAEKRGLRENLKSAIMTVAKPTFFGRPARALVFKDFAPYSFEFTIQAQSADGSWSTVLNGGIIYYGNGDDGSGAPQLSCRVGDDLREGWEVHT